MAPVLLEERKERGDNRRKKWQEGRKGERKPQKLNTGFSSKMVEFSDFILLCIL